MVNVIKTAKEIEEAKASKEEEELKVQIEVYEGQVYEAREKYEETAKKRRTVRSKLPEEVPTDASYKEQELQAQYIQANVVSPNQEKQVKEYRAEIKKQQTAKKEVEILDKEIPQLYTKAVEEVESVKTDVAQAKQKVADKYDSIIQTKTTALETEKVRRAKQFAEVEATYQKTVSANPYTDANRKIESAKHASKHFSQLRFNYEWGKASSNYLKSASQSKQSSMAEIRLEHYTKDEFPFVNAGALQRDAGQLMGDIARGKGMNYRNISAKGRYQVELVMAKRSLLAGGNEKQYFETVKKTQQKYGRYQQQQSDMRSAQARAKVAGYLKADSAHWASVASNPYTSNPNATTPNFTVGSGTKDDPFRTDYNKGKTAVGETTTPPKELLANYIQDYQKQSKTYSKANTGLENTNYSQADLQQINKQRENELANIRQTQHVAELRAGNIGYADALMNPQTTQSYTGTSTVNLKTFLKERGYDLTKPEAIPNSILTTPVKYDKAREVAFESAKLDTTMGDLRTKEPYYAGFSVRDGKMAWNYKYPLASKEVIQQRMEAKQRIAKFDPLTPAVQRKEGTKTGVKFTNLPAPQVGTLDSGGVFTKKDFNPYSASDPIGMAQGYQYVVPSKGVTAFPTITGQTFDAKTPTSFDTESEAKAYLKESKPKVFSGTDNDLWNKFQYASAVDSGELPNPKTTPTLVDDVRYYANVMNRPLINLGASVVNLTQPEDKQIPIYQTGAERLIGGTIDDTLEGQPLRGTGVTGTYNYVKQDPLRAVLELPAEAVMWVGGGKAVSLGTQAVRRGVKVITPTVQSVERSATRTGYNIVQSTKVPNIIKAPVQATMVTGRAVKSTLTFPYNPLTRSRMKQAEAIGSKNYPPEVPRQIEKIGSTYVITPVTTESFPQTVSAITVKFGKGGKTAYYSDTPQMIRKSDELLVTGTKLDIEGLKSLGFKGSITSPISKEDKFLYKVPLTKDNLYAMSSEEVPKRISQVGTKTTEPTRQAKLAEQGGLIEARLRPDTQESILSLGKMEKARKLPKEYDPQPEKSNILGTYKKTSTTQTKETMDLPPSKTGQTLDKPAPQSSSKGKKLKEFARAEAKADVKTSPYSSAIVGTATKASAVVGTKALASTRVDTGVKIQQEIKTGLVQETALKTQQELKTPQRLKTGMRMETGLKLDTGSKLMTQQKTALSFSSPIKTQSRTQRPKALPFVLPKVEETETRGKRKRGKKAGFIGNVRLDNIMGMYKRKEITYGQKKVTKLERQDMRLTAGTKNRIALPSSGLLKTKKKKKSKSETILGRTVTKTKDEFVGFKTKKQTKRRKKSKTTKVRLL